MAGRARVLAWLAALWLCAPVGASQGEQRDAAELRKFEEVLRQRNREALNPAPDPLRVIGLEQEGNDLRSRTPALLKGDLSAALLDPDAAYERALALYEDRTLNGTPPPRAPSTPQRAVPARERKHAERGGAPAAHDDGFGWSSTLPSFVLGALFVLWLFRRTMKSMQ